MYLFIPFQLEASCMNSASFNIPLHDPGSRAHTQKHHCWVGGNLNRYTCSLLEDGFGLLYSNTVSMGTYWVKVNMECQLCSQATMFLRKMTPERIVSSRIPRAYVTETE